jgi:hypothetical protein
VTDPDESVTVAPQLENLAAPDRFIAAVAGAVERHTDHGFTETSVLGQQRHHVRMVVLNQIQWSIARTALRPTPGVIPGVQVGGQSHRLVPDFTELTHRAFECPQGFQCLHVTDVPGQVCARTVGEAEGVLQFAADRQHRRAVEAQVNWQRRVAAGSADRQFATVHHPNHRVVAGHMDRPVVVEHRIA